MFSAEADHVTRLVPVSYTHLDVYKRQGGEGRTGDVDTDDRVACTRCVDTERSIT